jgi:hypothetical protein
VLYLGQLYILYGIVSQSYGYQPAYYIPLFDPHWDIGDVEYVREYFPILNRPLIYNQVEAAKCVELAH